MMDEGSATAAAKRKIDEVHTGDSQVDNRECFLYVLEEADIGKQTRRQLDRLGIDSTEKLLEQCEEFNSGSLDDINVDIQKKLYHICRWHEAFVEDHDRQPMWNIDFNFDSFQGFEVEFEKSNATQQNTPTESNKDKIVVLFERALKSLHEGKLRNLKGLSESDLKDLHDHVVKRVRKNLPPPLVKKCNFDVDDMILRVSKSIFNFPSGKPYEKVLVITGPTQSGKSFVKAVICATCDILMTFSLIVTHGVSESKDLDIKIKSHLAKTDSLYTEWLQKTNNANLGCKVIADTPAQVQGGITTIRSMLDATPHAKFIVIVDEADQTYRTEQKEQKTEKCFDTLRNKLQPALWVEISATPLPSLISLSKDGREIEMIKLGVDKDYCGVTAMRPLSSGGKDLYLDMDPDQKQDYRVGVPYLDPKNLKLKRYDTDRLFPSSVRSLSPKETESLSFTLNGRQENIPCTNEKVMKLYDDALSGSKKGVLLLDATVSKVNVDDNIFQKAACIQNQYAQKGKKMVVVCFVGSGIHFRRPGYLNGRKVAGRQISISDVLNKLDELFGLEMPFFVFGYTKMRRCMSYRSERRVTTHMLICLGNGYSIESFIQAIGRATFNGTKQLKGNGHPHVTVLTARNDFAMTKKYYNFIDDISERLTIEGITAFDEAISDERELFADSSNYFRHSNRKTGQNKNLKNYIPDQSRFEDPLESDSDDDEFEVDDEKMEPRVMIAIHDLVLAKVQADNPDDPRAGDCDLQQLKSANEVGCNLKDIINKYNEIHIEFGHTVKSSAIRKELTSLKEKAKIEKVAGKELWKAKNWAAFSKEVHKFRSTTEGAA
jgi:hypothetical protein